MADKVGDAARERRYDALHQPASEGEYYIFNTAMPLAPRGVSAGLGGGAAFGAGRCSWPLAAGAPGTTRHGPSTAECHRRGRGRCEMRCLVGRRSPVASASILACSHLFTLHHRPPRRRDRCAGLSPGRSEDSRAGDGPRRAWYRGVSGGPLAQRGAKWVVPGPFPDDTCIASQVGRLFHDLRSHKARGGAVGGEGRCAEGEGGGRGGSGGRGCCDARGDKSPVGGQDKTADAEVGW